MHQSFMLSLKNHLSLTSKTAACDMINSAVGISKFNHKTDGLCKRPNRLDKDAGFLSCQSLM